MQKGLINTIEIISGRKKLQRIYRELDRMNLKGAELWAEIIRKLDIHLEMDINQLQKIPQSGPLILIANHPFGVVDGLILGYILSRRRDDFTIIVHETLTKEKMIIKYLLPIDFKDTKAALQTNIQTRKECIARLKRDEAIAIFPSGSVATTKKLVSKKAEDLEWKRFTAKILTQTKATVVPIFFHGQNSPVFQVASHINQNIRYALLLREVLNKMGKRIKVDIHDPIPFEALPTDLSRQELLDYLKSITIPQIQN